MKKYTDVDIVAELQKLVDSHVAVSYTHLDVYKRQDAGREGELIFRLVYNKAGCTKPFKRLWISSLEDSAIREGFNHLRDGKEFDRLYEAALSRSKADWIVGINGTRPVSYTHLDVYKRQASR